MEKTILENLVIDDLRLQIFGNFSITTRQGKVNSFDSPLLMLLMFNDSAIPFTSSDSVIGYLSV